MYLIVFACKEYTLVFKNINLFESTAAIYNGKIVDTGAKELPLIHMYENSYFNFLLC